MPVNPGGKPCASCGAEVGHAAVGRGAVETPDGQRYCSPCAAALGLSSGPVIEVLPPGAVAAAPAPPAPPARKQSSSRIVAGRARVPVSAPSAPAASAPSKRQTSTRVIPAKKKTTAPAPAPAAPAAPEFPAAPSPSVADELITLMPVDDEKPPAGAATARKATTARLVPGKKPPGAAKPSAGAGAGAGATGAQRVSRRTSSRQVAPWYLRINRNQLIAVLGGAGLLLIVLIIGSAVAISGSRRQPVVRPVPEVSGPSHAYGLIAQADVLMHAGKRDEALKKLHEAVEEGRRTGDDRAVVEANRRINGINRSTPIGP